MLKCYVIVLDPCSQELCAKALRREKIKKPRSHMVAIIIVDAGSNGLIFKIKLLNSMLNSYFIRSSPVLNQDNFGT